MYKTLFAFVNASTILGLNDEVVNSTIELSRLRRIKLPDAVIAATAMVHNLTLVTRNVSDFKNIGLRLIKPWNWPLF